MNLKGGFDWGAAGLWLSLVHFNVFINDLEVVEGVLIRSAEDTKLEGIVNVLKDK